MEKGPRYPVVKKHLWKKPVTKDHILYDFIYMKYLEQANL